MPIKTDNPAGRLYMLLDEARKQPESAAYSQILENVLKASNPAEFFQRLVYLVELVEKVAQVLTNNKALNKELYLPQYQPIISLVNHRNYGTPWRDLKNNLNDIVMLNLAHIADMLPEEYAEKNIEQEVLEELIFEIEALIKKITESNLMSELKKIIVDQLSLILKSIREYNLRGAYGLREALVKCVGEFIYTYQLFEKEQGSEGVKDFKTVLWKIHNVIVSVYAYVPIAQDVVKLLGGPQ